MAINDNLPDQPVPACLKDSQDAQHYCRGGGLCKGNKPAKQNGVSTRSLTLAQALSAVLISLKLNMSRQSVIHRQCICDEQSMPAQVCCGVVEPDEEASQPLNARDRSLAGNPSPPTINTCSPRGGPARWQVRHMVV